MKSSHEKSNHLTDRSELSGLYFQAASSDEQLRKRLQREQRQQERLPRLGWLKIALRGGLLVIASLYFAQNVEVMVMGGNIGLIFLAFGLGLILFGLLIAWARYSQQIFTAYGRKATPFWVGLIVLLLTMVLIGRLWLPVSFMSVSYGLIMGLVFAVVFGTYLLTIMHLLGMYRQS